MHIILIQLSENIILLCKPDKLWKYEWIKCIERNNTGGEG